jgi:hypothetical protein
MGEAIPLPVGAGGAGSGAGVGLHFGEVPWRQQCSIPGRLVFILSLFSFISRL